MHRAAALSALGIIFLLSGRLACGAPAASGPLGFSVVNQRSVTLTAQAWNPILAYVSRKSGVALRLRMGKTAPETTDMTVKEGIAFAYTNHLFSVERDKLGYRAIARLGGPSIQGAIVVRYDSPVHSLEQLRGKTVVFPSVNAFVGYQVPIGHLRELSIEVDATFAGNQEGAIAQLKTGQAAGAGVNKKSLEQYAARSDFPYRLVWVSEPYIEHPIMAHPSLSAEDVAAVRKAFIEMARDAEGNNVLQASAAVLQLKEPWSFVAVDDKDYDVYRHFYKRMAQRPRPVRP